MVVSTILLSRDNKYVKDDGSLPKRPNFDKALLKALCENQIVSDEAYDMLPPSIKSVVNLPTKWEEPGIGITIPEIDALTDLLIVSRSNETILGGKTFRLDNFNLIVTTPHLDLYKRK